MLVFDHPLHLGACIVGLGDKVSGLYSSDEKLRDELLAAAKVLCAHTMSIISSKLGFIYYMNIS